jgi:hypothetical protein
MEIANQKLLEACKATERFLSPHNDPKTFNVPMRLLRQIREAIAAGEGQVTYLDIDDGPAEPVNPDGLHAQAKLVDEAFQNALNQAAPSSHFSTDGGKQITGPITLGGVPIRYVEGFDDAGPTRTFEEWQDHKQGEQE